jgi:predicted ester cyclase
MARSHVVIVRSRPVVLLGAVLAFGACAPPPPPPPAAPAVKTAEERTQWYRDCWDRFSNQAWDQFQTCYTENAISESVDSTPPSATGRTAIIERGKMEAAAFPDRRGEVRLVLANGDRMASIALYTGTNTGPLPPGPDGKAIPATGKPIGFLIAHTLQTDPTGSHADRDAAYVDEGTMLAQIGVTKTPARPVEKPTGASPTVVIARNDAAETGNVAVIEGFFDALNKKDFAAIDAARADDYKMVEIAAPKDRNKKEELASTKEMLAGFPDAKIVPTTSWGAGDYVVTSGTFEGTNLGPLPSMGLKKTGRKASARFLAVFRLDGGKVKEEWLFYNGAAFAAQLMPAK